MEKCSQSDFIVAGLTNEEYNLNLFTIKDSIDRSVELGFSSHNDIVNFAMYVYDDIRGDEGVEAVHATSQAIMVYTEKRLGKHLEKQEKWEGSTDCDKLDKAFAELEENGIVARQNFAWGLSDGCGEIGSEIEKYNSKSDSPAIGYTFFHSQDSDRALDHGLLSLIFGITDNNNTDEQCAIVGTKILEVLLSKGLTAEWSGDIDTRVEISGIKWQKRRL